MTAPEVRQSGKEVTYSVIHPRICLSSHATVPIFGVSIWNEVLPKVFTEVLHNRPTFCKNKGLVAAWHLNSDCGRLSDGMNLLERCWRPPVFVAEIRLDVIVNLQLFQKPNDALATGLIQPSVTSIQRYHTRMRMRN